MTNERMKKGWEAVNEALSEALGRMPEMVLFGLGVPDPKGVFGTTVGLREKYGARRVFDMPAAENAMTGVAIGAALCGLRPVMCHQRSDFALLAFDPLINGAAKWHYTFDGKNAVPLTVRLISGRGWGQGPTHSQNFQAMFAHVPGLKVVMPVFPADAKGLLLAAIEDNNPVLVLEHRWLHGVEGPVPEGYYTTPLGKAARLRSGTQATLVAMSYMTIEAVVAADHLAKRGVECDVIDLRTISPMDWGTVFESVRRTGRLLALDTGWTTGSVGSEIVARVTAECWESLHGAPRRLGLPDYPVPTSWGLTRSFYPGAPEIVETVQAMLGGKEDLGAEELRAARVVPHDVPGDWFKGPF